MYNPERAAMLYGEIQDGLIAAYHELRDGELDHIKRYDRKRYDELKYQWRTYVNELEEKRSKGRLGIISFEDIETEMAVGALKASRGLQIAGGLVCGGFALTMIYGMDCQWAAWSIVLIGLAALCGGGIWWIGRDR